MYTKRLNIAIYLLCFVCMVPFWGASIYTHPSADDYSYAVLALKKGVVESQITWYQEWSGRYAATALISFSPLFFSQIGLYKLAPVFWILLTWASMVLFLSSILPGKSPKFLLLTSTWVCTLYFCYMPEPTEGIYWYAGAATYQASAIVFLWTYYFIIKAIQVKRKNIGINTLFAALIAVVLVGLNETSMLMHVALLLSLLLIIRFYHSYWSRSLLLILAFSLIGSLIVYVAPGNSVRISHFPTSQKFLAFGESLLYAGFSFWKWLLLTPSLVILLVLSFYKPVEPQHTSWQNLRKIPPFVCWLTYFIVLYLGIFVGFWSLGFRPPPRTLNIIYLIFILGLLFNFSHSLPYIIARLQPRMPHKIIAGIFLIGYVFSPLNNSWKVSTQILSGQLMHFDQKMQMRYTRLAESNSSDLQVPFIPEAADNVVFYRDISSDSSYWANMDYAWYFGKKSIVLEDSTSQ